MPNTSKFVATLTGNELKLSGPMNETVDFYTLKIPSDSSVLKIDLGGVTTINSTGLRMFMIFLRSSKLIYEYFNCTAEFLDQLNMINSLLNKTDETKGVRSTAFQYQCTTCANEQVIRLNHSDLCSIAEKKDQSVINCPGCKRNVFFDVESLFYFLNA